MFAFNQLQSDKYKVPHEGSAKGPDSQIEVEIAREIVHVEPEEEGNGQRLSENGKYGLIKLNYEVVVGVTMLNETLREI